MTDALSLDASRTPHGKSEKAGSLHEEAPIHLLQSLYNALGEPDLQAKR